MSLNVTYALWHVFTGITLVCLSMPLTLYCLMTNLNHLLIEETLERQQNDFTAISFTDFHFKTKLRIPSGTSPIRMYDIALI